MKKRTFLLFGLLAMLVLTACGGKSGAQTSTDDATDTSDNSQQTTAEETAQPIGQHHAQITIKGEFSDNGVENKLSHTRGAVSMARSSNPDSASSQFFIVQQDSTYLDGQYACFGYVTKGMDVVDEICDNTPVEDDNGTVKTENQPVIESIKIID